MTRKHFKALAEIVANMNCSFAIRSQLAKELSSLCARGNSEFDRHKFFRACNMPPKWIEQN